MPVRVSFVLTRSYLQGSVLVEATDDPQRAVEMVEQMSNEQLIEHTCESEWDVDTWSDEPISQTSATSREPL